MEARYQKDVPLAAIFAPAGESDYAVLQSIGA
jgi:hypothetical protein